MGKNKKPLFGIGDKVEIIKYGRPTWASKGIAEEFSFPMIHEGCYDMSPELVGKIGLVSVVSITQGEPNYVIKGIDGKSAWYSEDQMKMINKNPNR